MDNLELLARLSTLTEVFMRVRIEFEVCPPPGRARVVSLEGEVIVMFPGGVVSIDPMEPTKHYNKCLKSYGYKVKQVGKGLFKLSSITCA